MASCFTISSDLSSAVRFQYLIRILIISNAFQTKLITHSLIEIHNPNLGLEIIFVERTTPEGAEAGAHMQAGKGNVELPVQINLSCHILQYTVSSGIVRKRKRSPRWIPNIVSILTYRELEYRFSAGFNSAFLRLFVQLHIRHALIVWGNKDNTVWWICLICDEFYCCQSMCIRQGMWFAEVELRGSKMVFRSRY